MKVVSNAIALLSASKNRRILILLFIFYIMICVAPFFNSKYIFWMFSDVPNAMELALVGIAFYILILSSRKSESNDRYRESWVFYKKKYSKVNLLTFYCPEGVKKITSSSFDYIKHSHADIDLLRNRIITLDMIDFDLEDIEYSLPFLIEERGRDILIDKFNIQEKSDYNGRTLALNKIVFFSDTESENKKLIQFKFSKSCYFNYLLTNMIPEHNIIPNLTVRDIIEPSNSGDLNDLEDSLAENHLGISSLISILIDDVPHFIIPKRSDSTTVFKGQLAPSVSGAANIHTCKKKGSLSIKFFFENELDEELKKVICTLSDEYKFEEFKLEFINQARLVGISRELKRLGKPELFFHFSSHLSVDSKHLRSFSKENSKYENVIEYKVDVSEKGIDYNENISFYFIKCDEIFDYFEEEKKVNTKGQTDIFPSLNLIKRIEADKSLYKMSESLLVNLLFYNENIL